MKTAKENKNYTNYANKNSNGNIKSNNAVISADEHLGGNPLTIKETLIWLEESKIFFYKIKKSLESK